tara:strand:+ start:462 stop:815 length:354 start_codon:yes stop_codon:yes gene_type:complete
MLRLGLVLSVVTLPLVGMEVINARQQEPLHVFQSAEDAVLACRIWQEAEGTFTAGSSGEIVQSALRSCEADLDHPVILGRRFSVVAGAQYNRPISSLHRSIAQRFPYLVRNEQTGFQ